MAFIARLFAAFCVATVVAQLLIVGLMALKGNLHSETVTQAWALVNGIDITGAQIEKAFDKAKETPAPSYEEIVNERARMSLDLQNLQSSIQREKESVSQLYADLASQTAQFDQRRQEFYAKVDEIEKKLVDESMQQVQRTIAELAPDQAKNQLLRMLEADRMNDVVIVVNALESSKRKKILSEFTDGEEGDKLHELLMQMLAGEPTASLIKDLRRNTPNIQ